MSKYEVLNRQIRGLKNQIEHLEADKEILNTVIDTANKLLNTNIRKRVFTSVFLGITDKEQIAPESTIPSKMYQRF